MSRLPYLRRDELGPAGQALWDGLVGGRGATLVGEHGGLVGPFNAFVTAPDTGKYLSSLGAKVRFGTSLGRRLSEIAIITTGARWQAEFEWWAHALAVTGYLPPEAAGSAPGRGRLAGRRILVVGAGTRPSSEPDAPVGNGRAISVLAAREGAAVACGSCAHRPCCCLRSAR